MKYSVVIPTYNHCDDLLKPCIESLLQYSNIADIELIISANGCKDNTFEYLGSLKEKFTYLGLADNLKIVWSHAPLGYAGATNEGIKVATTGLIVLLNNDVLILKQQPKSRWLDLLTKPFEVHNDCGITCVSKCFSECAGRDFAIFFCVMIHRKVFDKIGLLSMDYGVGAGEDTEFCIEAENAGFAIHEAVEKVWSPENNFYTGDFPLYHKGEGTVHDKNLVSDWDNIFYQNSLKLAKKYNPEWYKWKTSGTTLQSPVDIKDDDLTLKNLDNFKREFSFLKDQNDEVFYEIIERNIYRVDPNEYKDKFVIDIGANNGTYSLLASYSGAKRVIAVEPISTTYNSLVDNIRRAHITNILTFNQLVTNKSGETHKISVNTNSGHNSMYNVTENFENVKSITLAELLSYVDGTDIILKIDCEGAEYDILLNASREDLNRISQIGIEMHAEQHPIHKGFDILVNKLTEFGFTRKETEHLYLWNYDSNGNVVNMVPGPCRTDVWKRETPVTLPVQKLSEKLVAQHSKDIPTEFIWLKNQNEAIYNEIFVANQYSLTKENVQDRTVIDCGANIGAYSLYAAALGAKKVIAVEPATVTYNRFVENIIKSKLKNIFPFKKAVSDVDDKSIKLSLYPDSGGTANSLYNVVNDYEIVQSISLGTLLSKTEGNNILLKLDCEGSEYDVIMTATQEQMNRISEIVIEVHYDLHPTYKGRQVLEDKLKQFGFRNDYETQVYWFDGEDEHGNKINWREAPYNNQRWIR